MKEKPLDSRVYTHKDEKTATFISFFLSFSFCLSLCLVWYVFHFTVFIAQKSEQLHNFVENSVRFNDFDRLLEKTFRIESFVFIEHPQEIDSAIVIGDVILEYRLHYSAYVIVVTVVSFFFVVLFIRFYFTATIIWLIW